MLREFLNHITNLKNNTKKTPCLIMATESYIGSGRNMEIYYRTLMTSKVIKPIMVYTSYYSYTHAPSWIVNKILTKIKKNDHNVKDCKKFSCLKSRRDHRTQDQWNSEYINYIVLLRKRFGEKTIWLRDSTNEKIEQYMGHYIVQVFHGELFDLLRGYFLNESAKSYNRFWLLFVQGRLLKNRLVRKLKISTNDKRIIKIGRVINDTLYNGEINRKSVLKSYKLSLQNKTILYAPSWESGKIWPVGNIYNDINNLKKFCRLTKKWNTNLILRPHPISIHHHGVKSMYLNCVKQYKHVYFDDTTHSSPYGPNKSLIAADILITDLSSIAIDFMSLGKPSIFFYPDSKGRLWGRLPSYEKVKRFSYTVRTFLELQSLLEKLLFYKEAESVLDERDSVVKYVLERTDGSSGDIFRQYLELEVNKISIKDRINASYLKRYIHYRLFSLRNHEIKKYNIIDSMVKYQ